MEQGAAPGRLREGPGGGGREREDPGAGSGGVRGLLSRGRRWEQAGACLEPARGGGLLWLGIRGEGLTQFHHREGRRGSIQVDGEELVSGRSPGPNVAVNTKGSVYVGKSRAGPSAGRGGSCPLQCWCPLESPGLLGSWASAANRSSYSTPHRRSPERGRADRGQVLLGHHGLYQESGPALGRAWSATPAAPGPAAPRPGGGQHTPMRLLGTCCPTRTPGRAPANHIEYIIINIIMVNFL